MANSVEETVGVNNLLLAGNDVLDLEVGHQAVGLLLTEHLSSDGVEADGDLRVGQKTVGHGLAGTELVATDKDSDAAAVLGQEHSLLGGGVTTTDDEEGLVAEDGHGTVADSAGADTVLPVLLLTGKVEATSVGAGGDDDGVSSVSGLVGGTVTPFRPQLEGSLGKVDLGDGLGDNLRAEANRLLAHVLHQLSTANAVRETGEVLDVGGGGELTASGGAVSQHTLIEDGLEFSAGKVDGRGVGGGAGADDYVSRLDSSFMLLCLPYISQREKKIHLLTTLVCTILEVEVELTRRGALRLFDRTEAEGEEFCCRDDAAAAVNPREERRVEKGKRRKAEENRLAVLKGGKELDI